MDELTKMTLASLNSGLLEDHDIQSDSEDVILDMIEYRVTDLLDRSPEMLMSYMYRLDIDEYKIQTVFNRPSNISVARQLATLIWSRQKARTQTKLMYKKGNPDFWYEDEE